MFALFNLLPLVWRLVAIAGVIASLVGAYAYWHHRVYEQGYDAAIADVQKADNAAVDRAKTGATDIANCRSNNGAWDVTTGRCL